MKNVGRITLAFGAVAISSVTLAAPAMAATPAATVTPSTGLKNAQTVQVKFSGFHPATSTFVFQCSRKILTSAQASQYCALNHLKTVKSSATGSGATPLQVFTGQIGSVATSKCVSKSTCYVSVAQNTTPPAGVFKAIVFK